MAEKVVRSRMTPIENARLTDEEIGNASESCWDSDHPETCSYGSTVTGHLPRCVADAATAKALRVAAEWLEAKYDSYSDAVPRSYDWFRGYIAAVYDLRLAAAGAKRPEVEASP